MTSLLPIAVDFDGTLCEAAWSPERPDERPIGAPKRVNIIKVRELSRAGWHIVIYTARPWDDLEDVSVWLKANGVPFSRIVCGKLLAAAYVDDLAIHESSANWQPLNQALAIGGSKLSDGAVTALSSTLSNENASLVPQLGVGNAKHKF